MKIECGIIFLKGLVSVMNFVVMKICLPLKCSKLLRNVSPVMNLASFYFTCSFSFLKCCICDIVTPCRDVAPETFRDHLSMLYPLMEQFVKLDPVLKETDVSV